jgi:hypothetical protein
MKAKAILLYLGIVLDILAITEHLSNLGILNWLYFSVDKTIVLYSLIVLGTAFIVTYFVDSGFRRKGFSVSLVRRRPTWARGEYHYKTGDYGVEWHLFVPPFSAQPTLPWADGPFCPKCKRELENKKIGLPFGKMKWRCPICESTFPMPKGEVKERVEKNLAAYLRKKGEIP